MIMELLVATNVKKTYKIDKNPYEVLKGINLTIQNGDFVSVVGPSGSGKTTLLYVLSGLESYDGGSVMLFDKELANYTNQEKSKLRSKKIGFVFQFYNLISNLTVYENVLLASVLGDKHDKEHIIEVLDLVGMKDQINRYPSELSGGMQQRVAIARSLINNPDIIFADEPIGNLDYNNGIAIMKIFETLNKVHKKTILMVTHNEETTKYGNRLIHMLDGLVVKDEQTIS
jgi:putative ABC transport system ATP-binding protein